MIIFHLFFLPGFLALQKRSQENSNLLKVLLPSGILLYKLGRFLGFERIKNPIYKHFNAVIHGFSIF